MIDKTISHYQILQKLGEGGMGEVYRARDTKLDRDVALKIIRPDVAVKKEFRERFERETKAIAALNHPNIVTIHSVEESASVTFFTMEMVEGKKLDEVIPNDGMPLQRFFQIAIPLTDAVSAAHAQGITHRDLKPSNIMVDNEDRLRILDFGLAKLPEEPDSSGHAAVPLSQFVTEEGRILGTVAYMSPEQAEGKPVDHRSDVFSLGVILYEMATGQRPFHGDTPASTISSILRDTPASLTDLKHNLPRHMARIVKRCLTKEPDRRYQSVLDLRNELLDLKDEMDSGELQVPAGVLPVASRGRKGVLILATLAVALIAIGYGLNHWLRKDKAVQPSVQPEEVATEVMEQVLATQSGKATSAAISPDGKYVVYAYSDSGRASLRVKQIATGSDVEIVPASETLIEKIQVAPEGDYIYYLAQNDTRAIHKLPILGGMPRKVFEDNVQDFTLSPDGSQLVANIDIGDNRLLVRCSSEGGVRDTVATLDVFPYPHLAWSTEGNKIVAAGQDAADFSDIFLEIPLNGGRPRRFSDFSWTHLSGLAWLADGSALAVGGSIGQRSFQNPMQLWLLSKKGDGITRLTHDMSDYHQPSLDLAMQQLCAVRKETEQSIWIVPDGKHDQARQVSYMSWAGRWLVTLAWTPDGRLIYEDSEGKELHLWSIATDGTNPYKLTSEGTLNVGAVVSPDSTLLAYSSDRSGLVKIWVSDLDGSNVRQLTNGSGEEYLPQFTADGQWIIFNVMVNGSPTIRMASVTGDSIRLLLEGRAHTAVCSPDGARFACTAQDSADGRMKTMIFSFDGDEAPVVFAEPGPAQSLYLWTPDSRSLAFVRTTSGIENIWTQPVDGGAARQLTRFEDGRVMSFCWSTDGDSLAVARRKTKSNVVLIKNFMAGD